MNSVGAIFSRLGETLRYDKVASELDYTHVKRCERQKKLKVNKRENIDLWNKQKIIVTFQLRLKP